MTIDLPKSTAAGMSYVWDPERLAEVAVTRREEYMTAKPFPHIVIDDFIPSSDVLSRVLAELSASKAESWRRCEHQHSRKLSLNDLTKMGRSTLALLLQLNAHPITLFLERLTDIEGLIPDPDFTGGGIHRITRGGFLDVHADFNRLERLQLDRRLNLILYLNEDWNEAWGGHLELWNQDMSHCEKRIAPRLNRAVVFSTTDTSFHGHPTPLDCPDNRERCSLALYYYTNGRPQHEESPSHGTIYRNRRGRGGVRSVVRRLVPPILFDAVNVLRRRST